MFDNVDITSGIVEAKITSKKFIDKEHSPEFQTPSTRKTGLSNIDQTVNTGEGINASSIST